MKRMQTLKWAILLTCTALLLFAAPDAKAAALLLDDGTTRVVITDGGIGDLNPLVGGITYFGSIGSWTLNFTVGITKPALGTDQSPQMNLSTVNVTSRERASLTILFSDSGFTNSSSGFLSTVQGMTAGSVYYGAYYSATNREFETDSLISRLDFPKPSRFLDESYGSATLVSPYSLTLFTRIIHERPGETSVTENFAVSVPEPGTLILLGSGLLGLALTGARKKFRK